MSEREFDEMAEWAALEIRYSFRKIGHEIDELGVAIVYMFIRKLLVDYWQNNKVDFVNEEMRDFCFSLCDSVQTQTEEAVIAACEIYSKEYADFVKEFEEKRTKEAKNYEYSGIGFAKSGKRN